MLCLTVRQPWAWAIVAGLKRFENRAWHTRYRGPLLIHAGKSRVSLASPLPDGTTLEPASLTFRAIVGMVQLVSIVHVSEVENDPWATGPWCWRLSSPVLFERPIPFLPGQRRLFHVPDWALLTQCQRPAPLSA